MIIVIRSVRLTAAGFAVSWHPRDWPRDVRASVLDPGALPSGHELLTAGATVDVELSGSQIVAVSLAQPVGAVARPLTA